MTTTAPLMRKSLRMRPFFCGWRDRVFYTTRTCYLREQLTLNQWVLGSSPRWCTKECLTRKCRAFFLLFYFKKARSGAPSGILEQGGGTQCRKERHSAAFLSPRESPRWCTRKSRNECCGFFVAPFPSGRTRTSRKRSCSSRGDWSLKMVAGL